MLQQMAEKFYKENNIIAALSSHTKNRE